MSKRVGLLGLLLVIVMGTGATAQSPSPESSPLYAPDDMAFQIPRQVGDLSIAVEEFDAVEASTEYALSRWQDLLIPLGKEPSDVRAAMGASGDPDDFIPDGLVITAQRIDGVPAETWAEPYFYGVFAGIEPQDLPPDLLVEWQDHDGRRLMVVASSDGEVAQWRMFYYPKGEVLFMVGNFIEDPTQLAIEDVLAELP